MTFLGLHSDLWSFHRRRVRRATSFHVMEELKNAEGSLVNALAFSATPGARLLSEDRETLIDIINHVRNFIDHLEE